MKYGILFFLLAATIPLSALFRRNAWAASKAWLVMGFLPFALPLVHSNMALISTSDWTIQSVLTSAATGEMEWPGYAHALEISVLDVLAIALYWNLPKARHPLPFRTSMALYFIATLISIFQAPVPVATLFYVWQLARVFLVYAIVARASAIDPAVSFALLQGMAAGVLMEAAIALWQRFGLGILQPHGTFSHQNFLGIMMGFAIFPYLATLLAGRRIRLLPAAVIAASVLTVALTVSRGAVAMTSVGIAAVFITSALRGWTPHKSLVLLIGVFAIMAVTPFALRSLQDRFGVGNSFDPTYEYNDRLALERAAALILSDHPLGVGANNYILVAVNGGYDRAAGVAMSSATLLEEVHNAYWLVAAETGYLGLFAFVFFLLRPLTVAFQCGFSHRGDPKGDLLIGLGVTLLAIYIHSFWEWIFVDFDVQYMFAMTVGLVAGITQHLGYWSAAYSKSLRPGIRRPSIRTLALARGLSRRMPHPTASAFRPPQARPHMPANRHPTKEKDLNFKLKRLHDVLSKHWDTLFPRSPFGHG